MKDSHTFSKGGLFHVMGYDPPPHPPPGPCEWFYVRGDLHTAKPGNVPVLSPAACVKPRGTSPSSRRRSSWFTGGGGATHSPDLFRIISILPNVLILWMKTPACKNEFTSEGLLFTIIYKCKNASIFFILLTTFILFDPDKGLVRTAALQLPRR